MEKKKKEGGEIFYPFFFLGTLLLLGMLAGSMFELVCVWQGGFTGGGFTHKATMPAVLF